MIDDETWKRLRAWCLATDHALGTAEKCVRYLKFLERHHELDLEQVDRERVTLLLARGREAGTKPRTLNSWIRELNLWLRFREAGWKVPYYRNRGRPVIPVPDRRMVRRLRALTWPNPTTNARNRAILALLADVGIRRNELVRLDVADWTLTVEGDPIVVVRYGKGEKQRVLWIDESTDELLREYVDRHRIAAHPTALFTTDRDRVSYAYLGRIVKDAGLRVGVGWLSAHKLRHYTCDSLLDAGVSVPSVAELLGHENLETTALYRSKRLAKVRAEQEVRAASRARFGGKA